MERILRHLPAWSRSAWPVSWRSAAGYLLAAVGGGLAVWLWMIPSVARPVEPVIVPERVVRDPVTAPVSAFDWTHPPPPDFAIPPYARFLEGVKIVIDPGHGGRADRANWKVGPTGLREEQVNLRVALFLWDFLHAVGAEVTLTRTEDVYLHVDDDEDLRLRAELANRLQADLLLSIHHNAVERPEVNYTTLFYHGLIEQNPASVAAGRHLLTGLNDALRLERHVGVALRSDFAIYSRAGFAVLRQARVPAVLTEASFYTHPEEENRLRDPLYNRREAYGLFLGLARWAQAGLPRVALLPPDSQPTGGDDRWTVRLDDGLSRREGNGGDFPRIFAGSLRVRLDGREVPFDFDPRANIVTIPRPRTPRNRPAELYVDFLNKFSQPVLHPRLAVE